MQRFRYFFLLYLRWFFSRFVYQTVDRMRRWLDLTCRCLCVELVVEQGEGWMLASTAPPVQGTGAPVPAELRDFPPPPSLSLASLSLPVSAQLSRSAHFSFGETSAFSISPHACRSHHGWLAGFRFHLDFELGASVTSCRGDFNTAQHNPAQACNTFILNRYVY